MKAQLRNEHDRAKDRFWGTLALALTAVVTAVLFVDVRSQFRSHPRVLEVRAVAAAGSPTSVDREQILAAFAGLRTSTDFREDPEDDWTYLDLEAEDPLPGVHGPQLGTWHQVHVFSDVFGEDVPMPDPPDSPELQGLAPIEAWLAPVLADNSIVDAVEVRASRDRMAVLRRGEAVGRVLAQAPRGAVVVRGYDDWLVDGDWALGQLEVYDPDESGMPRSDLKSIIGSPQRHDIEAVPFFYHVVVALVYLFFQDHKVLALLTAAALVVTLLAAKRVRGRRRATEGQTPSAD